MNNYLIAIEAMGKVLDLSGNPLKSFNRKEYTSSFQKFYQDFLPAMEAVEILYNSVEEPETMLGNMADAITKAAAGHVNSVKSRNQKDIRLMNLNMQLAVYIYPSVLMFNGKSSEAFANTLHAKWKETFPKTDVQIADYEKIQAGFHRKFCYITTAVCTVLGKSDDCYELELLRSYRDGYLSSLPEGPELIHTYYDVAPSIVKHIAEREEGTKIYEDILERYINPCIGMIEKGEDESCAKLYTEMVLGLKDQYFNKQ